MRHLPPLLLQAQRLLKHTPVAVVVVAVGLVTLLVHGYRLSVAPDLLADECAYFLIGSNLARGLGLVMDHQVFLWHPPAYFLIEGAYIKLAGLTNANLLATLLSVRRLNIFFSASTAALLMLFGCKLHSYKAGLATAGLFLMDPYVQRINRRNMLETLTMLCVLLSLYMFFTYRPHLTWWQRLGSGVALGLAVLTKEAAFLELFTLIAYVIWFRRSQLRDVAYITATACAVYLAYPAWAFAAGYGARYLAYKLFNIERLLNSFPGFPHPHPPADAVLVTPGRPQFALENLQVLLPQYVMSYLLIALAASFTVVLLLRFRHLVAARYLITCSIFSFGIGLALGKISDQYFYFLILPCTIIVGYVLASLLETGLSSRSLEKTSILDQSKLVFPGTSIEYRLMWRPVFAVFIVILLYNGYVWREKYVIGSDDSYIKALEYVKTHVPKGVTIVSSDDIGDYFLLPEYHVSYERSPKTIMHCHGCYFLMTSRDVWYRELGMTPQFYEWVLGHSRPLFEQYDLSFWMVGVYVQTAAAPSAQDN